jgi:protein O-GlcNAc transferase
MNTSPLQAAILHQMAGRLPEAEALYRQILSTAPDHPDALYLLGMIAYEVGKNGASVELIGRALSLNPRFVEGHNNIGLALHRMERYAEAAGHFRAALALRPDYADAHSNLGLTLHAQGRPVDAVGHYRTALALKPDPETYNNLGIVQKAQNELEAAAENFLKALLLKPDYAIAHYNLGNVFTQQGKHDRAAESYRSALALKPDYAEAHSNWLFLHSFHHSLDHRAYLSLARGWEQASVPVEARRLAREKIFRRAPLSGRRLKLGYVSGDYRQHPVSYFVEQLFARHDRARVEVFAYSASGMRDAVTERLQTSVDHWVPVERMGDAAAAERIEADKIDVLIDLSGHTEHSRLGVFARRAAPVQASYLGYFASTGLTEMDYWIGDATLTPPEMDEHFSERVWRLPRVWVAYKTIADAPEPAWRPAADGQVWLGSFNNLGKLTPATLSLWARVLHALPEGKLLLKTKELADAGNRGRILDALAAHGIPASRIELRRESDWQSYMAAYNRLDIALDPVGAHGGGTITCDALWMGVPVVHSLGDRATSRFTASMLDAIGHPEWIAHSEAEYIARAVALARDVALRRALRAGQRSRMAASPLCDARDLAAALENAYFEMFERWQAKQDARSL